MVANNENSQEAPLTVSVYVDTATSYDPETGIQAVNISIRCVPMTLPVTPENKSVTLIFELMSRDYQFPAVGAIMPTPSSSQFPLDSWTSSDGRQAKLFDYNSNAVPTPYSYFVRVMPRVPFQCPAVIMNCAPYSGS